MSRIEGKYLLDFFEQVVPSGTVNGSNTAFTIAQAPMESANLLVFKNGLLQKQGTDYTFSGTTITFAVAPATASELIAYYIRETGS